ncbi:MAG: hypothetical protein ACRELV_17500 [Longimicrobiales bacterium]
MSGRAVRSGGRLPWARLAAEFATIVLGVLLALGVSQWWEGREDEAAVRSTLAAFHAELVRNRDVLERRLSYHETLIPRLDSLSVLARADGLDVMSAQPFPEGTMFLPLSNAAWTTAVATQSIGLVEPDTLRPIAAAYTSQDVLRELERAGTAALYVPRSFERENAASTLAYARVLFGDIVADERRVLVIIDRALEVLAPSAGRL